MNHKRRMCRNDGSILREWSVSCFSSWIPSKLHAPVRPREFSQKIPQAAKSLRSGKKPVDHSPGEKSILYLVTWQVTKSGHPTTKVMDCGYWQTWFRLCMIHTRDCFVFPFFRPVSIYASREWEVTHSTVDNKGVLIIYRWIWIIVRHTGRKIVVRGKVI